MAYVWVILFCAWLVWVVAGIIHIATAPPSPYTEMAILIAKRQTDVD
jgi:hypothetical protein